jgi:hypothetical protein
MAAVGIRRIEHHHIDAGVGIRELTSDPISVNRRRLRRFQKTPWPQVTSTSHVPRALA